MSIYNQKERDNVLINDLADFLGTIWIQIKKEKDINLPAEKLLLSQFWCNAVKDEALALVQSEYTKLEKECQNNFVETFKTRASSILKIAFDHYLKNTKSYDKATKEIIFENDLWLKLEQDLNKLYDTTSNNLKK